jgi:putative addiction module component (TIGR02574 family)
MPSTFNSVAEQALSLRAEDRIRLATELLQSVEPEAGDEVERAWEQEILRRIAQIDSGDARGRSWDDIKRDFDSRYAS